MNKTDPFSLSSNIHETPTTLNISFIFFDRQQLGGRGLVRDISSNFIILPLVCGIIKTSVKKKPYIYITIRKSQETLRLFMCIFIFSRPRFIKCLKIKNLKVNVNFIIVYMSE